MAANPEVSCGTRKSRDKRVKRHTVGLFVVAYPCGVVVVCDELFGSESISQVGQSSYRICTFKSISFNHSLLTDHLYIISIVLMLLKDVLFLYNLFVLFLF